MIIDSIDIEDLGENIEEAFLLFESRLRETLQHEKTEDRRLYTNNGDYTGSFLPERYYVSSILAFLDEYELETSTPHKSEPVSPVKSEPLYAQVL